MPVFYFLTWVVFFLRKSSRLTTLLSSDSGVNFSSSGNSISLPALGATFGWNESIKSTDGSLNSIKAEKGILIKKGRPSKVN